MIGQLALVAGGLAAALLAARRGCVLVRVTGHSMAPSHRDGDLLLGVRWARLRAGRVVVFRSPPGVGNLGGPPYRVKRLTATAGQPTPDGLPGHRVGAPVPPGFLVVRGDDPRAEDSRHYGYLPSRQVIAVVVLRLPVRRRHSFADLR